MTSDSHVELLQILGYDRSSVWDSENIGKLISEAPIKSVSLRDIGYNSFMQ